MLARCRHNGFAGEIKRRFHHVERDAHRLAQFERARHIRAFHESVPDNDAQEAVAEFRNRDALSLLDRRGVRCQHRDQHDTVVQNLVVLQIME